MAIRSGRGDKGYTDLAFNKRVSKDSYDIRVLGDLDEMNGYLGLVKCKTRTKKYRDILERMQHAIFQISTEIAVGHEKKTKLGPILKKTDADWIKKVIVELETKIELEHCFKLPGSTELSAITDVARAVARRAERSVVRLFQKDKIKDYTVITYLNCVSDVLFMMAREKSRSRSGRRKPRK